MHDDVLTWYCWSTMCKQHGAVASTLHTTSDSLHSSSHTLHNMLACVCRSSSASNTLTPFNFSLLLLALMLLLRRKSCDHAGIHGSFTEQYLPPTAAGEHSEYDIRNGLGTQATPKYN